ncbi:Hypothetical protein SSA_1367 [Streptococcus sanguinis SK36]|uniref:Uncharacterized protein n=1 Tax=Streptococcus sanguinis (strain SK36) TaxID=388919 RepID=A3CNL0_STRSV|nr:Hypothetical protein SSA_1367 [Streptococcus sanguinis SK36]
MVHQIQHGDRLIIAKIAEKAFWQISFDVCFQVDFALKPELHGRHPDRQFSD